MREFELDEFESLFERASIPVFDIAGVELASIAAIMCGQQLDHSIVALAAYLAKRFGGKTTVYSPVGISSEAGARFLQEQGHGTAGEQFDSPEELAGRLDETACELVLLPEPDAQGERVSILDELARLATVPILIVRNPIAQARDVFKNVLHSLTGNLEQIEHLAYSFHLVEDHGKLVLLHIVELEDLDDVRETLKVSPEISSEAGDELVADLAHHAERHLKGLVAATRDEPYDVSYRLSAGEVLPEVQREVDRGGYGLLVVGTHREGMRHLDADEYQMMHLVRDIPVLAL